MKKIFSILAIACIAMLFSACHKDGIFNPKKKIHKIYGSSSYTVDGNTHNYSKELQEVWTWNKNNTLAKIETYSGSDIYSTETFSYNNKKQILKAEGTVPSENSTFSIEFKYKNNKLIEASYYYDNNLTGTYKFTHNKNQITKIEEYYDMSKGSVTNHIRALRFILPDQLYQTIEEQEKKMPTCGSKGYLATVYEFTWDKDNIVKMVTTEPNETGDGEGYSFTTEFQYDNYNNPYNGFWDAEGVEIFGGFCSSKNNIVKKNIIYKEGDFNESYTYDYTYIDKFPLTASHTQAEANYSYTNTLEYEYK